MFTRALNVPKTLVASHRVIAVGFLVLSVLATPGNAQSSVRVKAERRFQVATKYDALLSALEGESPSRAMFLSQHVELLSFVPRTSPDATADDANSSDTDHETPESDTLEHDDSTDSAEEREGASSDEDAKKAEEVDEEKEEEEEEQTDEDADQSVRATIDIVGCSNEFGQMLYTMSIVANDKLTTIDVVLKRPVGMLTGQHYQFLIAPVGTDHSSVEVRHTLDVRLMQRKLNVINQIIKQVTCKEASKQVHELTSAMSNCVFQLATSANVKASTDSSTDTSSEGPSSDSDTASDSEENVTEEMDSAEQEAGAKSADNNQEHSSSPLNSSNSTEVEQKPSAPETLSVPTPDVQEKSETQAELNVESASASDKAAAAVESNQPEQLEPQAVVPPSVPQQANPAKADPSQVDPPGAAQEVTQEAAPDKPAPDETAPNKPTPEPSAVEKTVPQAVEAKPKITLKVKMKVANAKKGSVRIAVFDSKRQFDKFDARKEENKQGDAFRKKEIKVNGADVECEFDDLPAGDYVIAAFYDADSNKKLNASFLGLPSEPYGFSRDARGQLGAPNYEDAKIRFDAEHQSVSFSLK